MQARQLQERESVVTRRKLSLRMQIAPRAPAVADFPPDAVAHIELRAISEEEQAVFEAINQARAKPGDFADFLKDRLKYIKVDRVV